MYNSRYAQHRILDAWAGQDAYVLPKQLTPRQLAALDVDSIGEPSRRQRWLGTVPLVSQALAVGANWAESREWRSFIGGLREARVERAPRRPPRRARRRGGDGARGVGVGGRAARVRRRQPTASSRRRRGRRRSGSAASSSATHSSRRRAAAGHLPGRPYTSSWRLLPGHLGPPLRRSLGALGRAQGVRLRRPGAPRVRSDHSRADDVRPQVQVRRAGRRRRPPVRARRGAAGHRRAAGGAEHADVVPRPLRPRGADEDEAAGRRAAHAVGRDARRRRGALPVAPGADPSVAAAAVEAARAESKGGDELGVVEIDSDGRKLYTLTVSSAALGEHPETWRLASHSREDAAEWATALGLAVQRVDGSSTTARGSWTARRTTS